jgi:Leucine-rich repeat (LRR) protein
MESICGNRNGVSCDGGQVSSISLSNNNLSGTIPESISDLTNLQILYLDTNRLTSIPGNLTGLTSLSEVTIRNNYLSLCEMSTELKTFINEKA